MIKRGFLLIITLSFSLLAKAQQPNIVWIVSEDNSKHYMQLFDANGIETPNIQKLAKEGVVFQRAFSNAAVCSAARSTLITSTYGPRLATHYHRAEGKITLNSTQEMFPAYLKKAGYYTTNNAKEDYNIFKSENVWDDSSNKASWRNRSENQPFFHVFNIGTTHEGKLHFSKESMLSEKTKTNTANVFVQPNHPNTETFKYTNAFYRDKIVEMDGEVGAVIAELKKDGLLDDTFIFYYGDHGGVLPGSKGYLKEVGLHVPLVVYIPENFKHLTVFKKGEQTNAFVSFVDFGATVLNIAGVEIPETMDGEPFLGLNISKKSLENRNTTFGYADRFDEKYDMVRSFRKGKYKYIRNFQPINPDGLMNDYRYKQLAYAEWWNMFKQGKLNKEQASFFEPKLAEELYDVEKDPYETNNLALNKNFQNKLNDLRANLNDKLLEVNDLSFYPEYYLIKNAISNPSVFGAEHKIDISNYLNIANLQYQEFENISKKLGRFLNSNDTWERYWALTVCSSFGNEASEFVPKLEEISRADSELINRVRAAEYLAIIGKENPTTVMTNALYESNDKVEALLILNSITLMRDFYGKYEFNIEPAKLTTEVRDGIQIKRRLKYLATK